MEINELPLVFNHLSRLRRSRLGCHYTDIQGCPVLTTDLNAAFSWHKTREGHEFWDNLYHAERSRRFPAVKRYMPQEFVWSYNAIVGITCFTPGETSLLNTYEVDGLNKNTWQGLVKIYIAQKGEHCYYVTPLETTTFPDPFPRRVFDGWVKILKITRIIQ